MDKVDLYTPYSELLYEYELKNETTTDWEKALGLLAETTTAYASDVADVKKQTSYDISQAYANYKKSQLNLLQNQQLGAGFKEQLSSELRGDYSAVYSGIRATEKEQLSSLTSAYTSKYDKYTKEAQEALNKEVKMYTDLDSAVLKFNEIGSIAEAEQQGYYKKQELTSEESAELKLLSDKTSRSTDEQTRYNELINKQNEYVLTEKGKDLYSKTYLSTFTGDDGQVYTFTDWLRNNEEYGDVVADYYLANKAKVGELTAGFSAEEMSGTYDPYKYRSYITSPEQMQEKNSFNITVNENAEYIYENLLSEEDRKKYDDLTQSVQGLTVGLFDTSGEKYLENVEAQKMEILKKYEVVNNNPYGINIKDAKKAVSAIDVTTTSFGDFAGTGKGTEQDKWLEELKRAAKNNEIPNGAIVDMNYGAGKKHNYVYYGGYWYPTNLSATYKDAKDTKGKLEKKK